MGWLRRAAPSSIPVGGGLVTLVLVTGALVAAPLGPAGLPILYTAPYAHTQTLPTFSSLSSGCASASQKALHWRALLGKLSWSSLSVARSCGPLVRALGAGSASYDAVDVTIGVPIASLPGSATPTTVSVSWLLSVYVNASLRKGGTCPAVLVNPSNGSGEQFCYAGGAATLDGFAYLQDLTNGSIFDAVNGWGGVFAYDLEYNETDCSNFQCTNLNYTYGATNSGLLPVTATWWINATLNHADRYEVVTELAANATAVSVGYPYARGASGIDFASLGRSALLAFVQVG